MKNIKTLKQKLNEIYNYKDLQTTCSHNCVCCKTACPQMYFSEFSNIINKIWEKENKESKTELICKSLEYFFYYDFKKFKMKTLIKPCMLLDSNGLCKYYDERPLNCRLYGLWPKDSYEKRVDKFEKAYEGSLKREEIPLNTQCTNVKRKNTNEVLKIEEIDELYEMMDNMDLSMSIFTENQIKYKENYRTFHDWLLLKVFGEEKLVQLTNFMLAASPEIIEDQIKIMKEVVRKDIKI